MKKKTVTRALVALATLASLTTAGGAHAADDLRDALAQQKLNMQDTQALRAGMMAKADDGCALNGAIAMSPAGNPLHCVDHHWQGWSGEWADVTFTVRPESADPAHVRPHLVDTFPAMVGDVSTHAFTYSSVSLANTGTPGTLVPQVREKTLSLVMRVVDFSADHTLAHVKMTITRSDLSATTDVESTIPVGKATHVLSLDGTEYTVLIKNLTLS